MSSNEAEKNSKIRYLYSALLIILAIFFALSGFLEVTKNHLTYLKTLQMGYPPYFIVTLGIAKILGAIVLLIPSLNRLKEWVFAGLVFDVIFAFISGLAINNYTDCVKAVVAFCFILITYFLFKKVSEIKHVS